MGGLSFALDGVDATRFVFVFLVVYRLPCVGEEDQVSKGDFCRISMLIKQVCMLPLILHVSHEDNGLKVLGGPLTIL